MEAEDKRVINFRSYQQSKNREAIRQVYEDMRAERAQVERQYDEVELEHTKLRATIWSKVPVLGGFLINNSERKQAYYYERIGRMIKHEELFEKVFFYKEVATG